MYNVYYICYAPFIYLSNLCPNPYPYLPLSTPLPLYLYVYIGIWWHHSGPGGAICRWDSQGVCIDCRYIDNCIGALVGGGKTTHRYDLVCVISIYMYLYTTTYIYLYMHNYMYTYLSHYLYLYIYIYRVASAIVCLSIYIHSKFPPVPVPDKKGVEAKNQ